MNPGVQRALAAELQRELHPDHALFGSPVSAVARRQDCDDVLFMLNDGRVAIVHLTCSGKRGAVADDPWTVFFDSIDSFIEQSMKPEHQEWGITNG